VTLRSERTGCPLNCRLSQGSQPIPSLSLDCEDLLTDGRARNACDTLRRKDGPLGSPPFPPITGRVRYRFGLFELDASAPRRLVRQGHEVRIQDQPFQLLLGLVERHGEVVTREELRQRLWAGNTFVDFDKGLGVALTKLRDALGDDASNPRFIETLPKRGYRFIAPVERDDQPKPALAQSRPGSAQVDAIQGRSGWHLKAILAATVCIGIIIVALVTGDRSHWIRPHAAPPVATSSAVPRVPARRSVAVLGFRNLPGRPDEDWLSAAFSEMLDTELAAGGTLRVVAGEDVAQATRRLPVANADALAKTTLERLRADPGADAVVLGSYTVLPGKGENRIRLDIRVQDTSNGEMIDEEALTGSEENLFDLVSHAGAHLRKSLGVAGISAEASNGARQTLPSNQTAMRLYAEGRTKLFLFDFLAARDLLVKAVAADPEYPLAHSALSEAWWHLGYEGKARMEAKRALDLSGHLPEEQHLLIEGQYRRATEDWPRVVAAHQSLFHLFPDNLDYGLLLASAQINLKPADALQTLETLRHLRRPAGDDARIDMVAASAWINTNFTNARAAAQRAIAKASAEGAVVVVGRTYGILCQQAPSIGPSVETISNCQSAEQSAIAAGDRHSEAMMLSNLAGLYYEGGDLVRAEGMWRQALDTFRRVGDPDGVGTALNNIGDARLMQGNLDEARHFLEQALPEYRAVDDKDGVARALNDLGDVSRQEGNLDAAEMSYQAAKATAQEIDDRSAAAYVLAGLGDVLMDRGNLAGARTFHEQSLAIRNQTGEKQAAAESRTALAALSIQEGNPGGAEAVLRDCIAQFHQAHQSDDELIAISDLIDAQLAQGKQSDASTNVAQAGAGAAKSQNVRIRLEFALQSARVSLASRSPESARIPLQHVQQQAIRHRFLSLAYEARLALADLEQRTGKVAAAKAQLASLHESARVNGFGLIARKVASEASAARLTR